MDLRIAALWLSVFVACGAPQAETASPAARTSTSYMPRSSAFVVRARLDRLRATHVWQLFEPRLRDMFADLPVVIDKTRTVTIATGNDVEARDHIVIVLDGLPRRDVDAEATRAAATITDTDGVTVYRGKRQLFAWWVKPDLVVVAPWVTDASLLHDIQRDSQGIDGNPEMQALLQKPHPDATVWSVVAPDAALASRLDWGAPPRALWGEVDLSGKVELNVAIRLADAAGARAVQTTIAGQLAAMKAQPGASYLANTNVSVDRDTVMLSQTMTELELDQLVASIAPATTGSR